MSSQDLDQNYYDRRASMFTRATDVHKFRFSSPLNIARRSIRSKERSKEKDGQTNELQPDLATSGHGPEGLTSVDGSVEKRRRRKKKKRREVGNVNPSPYNTMEHNSHLNCLIELIDSRNRLPRISERTSGLDKIPEEG
ncbi:hypothetical protein ACF0H5_013932 [Mactra antiquata]